jgi:hypothetical protein
MFRTTRHFRKNDRQQNFFGEGDYVRIEKGYVARLDRQEKQKNLPKKPQTEKNVSGDSP